MAETAFLNRVRDFLETGVVLSPAPAVVGTAEPTVGTDLPSVVLSLDATERLDPGIGARNEAMEGALAASATVDLASPFVPGAPELSLVSENRHDLILPHGGLVDREGGDGPLGAADVQVFLNGNPVTLTPGTPAAGEVSLSPLDGVLSFGTELPGAGEVRANYFLGQWERRVVKIAGVLRADVLANSATGAESLSNGVVGALSSDAAVEAIGGELALAPASLTPVSPPEQIVAGARRRGATFTFRYEHTIDQPESAGGLIRIVRVRMHLDEPPVATETMEIVEQ